MSLKSQLRISIVTLVTLLVIAQSVVSLRIAAKAKFDDALERAEAIAQQVRNLVVQRVNEQARAHRPAPKTLMELTELMQRLVAEDRALVVLLPQTTGPAAIIEIMITDDVGVILASSLSQRQRVTYPSLPDLSEWQRRPQLEKILEVLIPSQSREYAIVKPIGFEKSHRPVLTVRVVVSTLLIRDAIQPHVQTLAAVMLLSLIASIVLAYLFSNVLLRNLDRLSQRISSIATGEYTAAAAPASGKEAKEFADMQSKLDVLSRQFRGAKEDIIQLRNNIEGMLERLEEGVLLFDSDQRLLRCSRSAEHLLALNPEQLAGRKLGDLFPPSTPLGSLLNQAIAQSRPLRDVPVTLERGAAGPVRLLVNVELLDSHAQAGRSTMLLTLRDAETRRQLRSQLDISTRLAAISRLTGGVAHEIKNPLNAMALHLEILKAKLNGEQTVEKELKVIGGEIARLDRVVKTFLDFTRPVDLRLKDLDLAEIARQVVALVQPEAERGGVGVQLEGGAGRMLVRADEDLLKQALLNVVHNGVEAMQPGGRLDIRLSRDGGDAVVTVTDRGIGIPREVRDKIFNLYFTTKEKGSGIGLAMTFRIVQLHNGTIDFISEPGAGTTFRMRFPTPEETEPSGSTLAPEAVQAGAQL
jgi:hypothetical protein